MTAPSLLALAFLLGALACAAMPPKPAPPPPVPAPREEPRVYLCTSDGRVEICTPPPDVWTETQP